MDYLQLYNLERHLFDHVSRSFQQNGKLTAFEFFCIVIWKSNRSKSKVALKLLAKDRQQRRILPPIVEDVTSCIYRAHTDKERMRILIVDWGFRLPIASAILTVLYPEVFTVYDVRVCEQLGNHGGVHWKTRFDDLWNGYEVYRSAVMATEPSEPCLRNKDRILWARSFERQLKDDITSLFSRDDEDSQQRN